MAVISANPVSATDDARRVGRIAPADDSADRSRANAETHLLTVALEDYFQVKAFRPLITPDQWYRFDSRLERGAEQVLDLLRRHDARATFFVTGWIAERRPDVVQRVVTEGHEIACSGYYHASLGEMSRAQFRDDARRSRDAVENASGLRARGFRIAHGWFGPADLWALEELAAEGFAYDSSVLPRLRDFGSEPWRQFPHQHRCAAGDIWEIPPSSIDYFGCAIPFCGGNYFRQLPAWWTRHAINAWRKRTPAPLVLYCHSWELDVEQPRVSAASRMAHVRHYRNLDKMQRLLEENLARRRFQSIADYLRLPAQVAEQRVSPGASSATTVERISTGADRAASARTPISIVVPCYNEEHSLSYLANTLESVERDLSDRYDCRFVFVNDGSSDGTRALLDKLFAGRTNAQIIDHDRNRGITAAVLTGIHAAKTEVVCAIDCDCSYDPHGLKDMIPLLTDEVALVTASPYHPAGAVRNVPGWRLTLSRGASTMYRFVLRQKLHTYTSCFRVYRRSAVLPLEVNEPGFLGITELLCRLDLQGAKIRETPAVLHVRVFGRSKMKVARTIAAHLKLIARLAMLRLKNPLPRK